jgi:hypothetical protein
VPVPLARDIVEVFEAIPDRIEVSGHAPTWQVTGGSFESVLSFANEAFGDPAVIARQDRRRWWPRVTLTVTKDPALAAKAPPLEALADPEPEPEPMPQPGPASQPEPEPAMNRLPSLDAGQKAGAAAEAEPEPAAQGHTEARLEDMFAYQEALRVSAAERRVPSQRRRR